MLHRLLLTTLLALPAGAITLYDDTLGNTPGAQPWLVFGQNSFLTGGAFAEAPVASGVRLTSDQAVSAGYSNFLPVVNSLKNAAFPMLDRTAGFVLSFELLLHAEAHATADRAGFNVILLASDHQGIELGFWGNEIWAQSSTPLFTHAEGVAFNTSATEVAYQLHILGSTYTLLANGNPILSGALRDYSAVGSPYTLGNFIFLGDDTSSAGADVSLGLVTLTAVPEPATWTLAAVALLGLARRHRRDPAV